MTDEDLLSLFDRPIAFHPGFVKLTGSVNAALMLSQAFYWTKRTKAETDNWFYKSREQWENETCLNRREQENARKLLRATGFWEEERKGNPARMYYRINVQAFKERIRGNTEPSLTLEQVLSQCKASLAGLSKTGLMRAKRLGVQAEYVDYAEVLKNRGMVCGICNNPILRPTGQKRGFLAFDHVIPLSGDGSHTLGNLQPAHVECNGLKSNTVIKLTDPTSRSSVDQLEGLSETDRKVYTRPTPRARPNDLTETTAKTTTIAQALRAAQVADTGKLMQILKRETGPIANTAAQAKAIKWLLDHGYTVAECEACLQALCAQEWRTTTVSWWTVTKEIEKQSNNGKNRQLTKDQRTARDGYTFKPKSVIE